MRIVRHIYAFVAAILLLTALSCSKEGGREPSLPKMSGDEVVFYVGSANSPVQSKAAARLTSGDSLMTYGGGFAIYGAYHTAPSFPGTTENKPQSLFYNIPVERDDEVIPPSDASVDAHPWHTVPTIYWPYVGKVSFFAYAPYNADRDSLVVTTRYDTAEYPQLTFTPNPKATKQVDLLTGIALNKTGAEGEAVYRVGKGYVDMDLYHQLTWIDFRAKASYEGTTEQFNSWLNSNFGSGTCVGVSSITLTGILSSNTGTYADPSSVTRGFTWENPSYDASKYNGEYILSVEGGELKSPSHAPLASTESFNEGYTVIVEGDGDGNNTENGLLYLLPQTLPSTARLKVEYGIFKTDSGDPLMLYSASFNIGDLPDGKNIWGPGKHIRYQLTLPLTEISKATITANVTDWEIGHNYDHGTYLE